MHPLLKFRPYDPQWVYPKVQSGIREEDGVPFRKTILVFNHENIDYYCWIVTYYYPGLTGLNEAFKKYQVDVATKEIQEVLSELKPGQIPPDYLIQPIPKT